VNCKYDILFVQSGPKKPHKVNNKIMVP